MEKTAEKTNTANTTMISTNCASHDMVVQILTEHKIASVSYTHLDVYKRQQQLNTPKSTTQIKTESRNMLKST